MMWHDTNIFSDKKLACFYSHRDENLAIGRVHRDHPFVMLPAGFPSLGNPNSSS